MKYKLKWYDGGLVPVMYAFVPNEKIWSNTIKTLETDISYPTTQAACTWFKKPGLVRCLITVREDTGHNLFQITGLIAHEAVHVLQAVCQNMGEEYPSEEFVAYGVQQVYLNMLDEYLLYNKKTGIKWKK